MIRYLLLFEVVELHRQIIEQSGGALGIRDLGALESALAQPRMTFGGEELYQTLVDRGISKPQSSKRTHRLLFFYLS